MTDQYPHEIGASDRLWALLKKKSGKDRPASYAREVLWKHVTEDQANSSVDWDSPSMKDVPKPNYYVPRSDFDPEWIELGCDDVLDSGFTLALRWLIQDAGNEQRALIWARRKYAQEQAGTLDSLRGLIMSKYKKAMGNAG